MINLSKHFKRSEFACRCGCGWSTVDAALIRVLEDVREHFGQPIIINSGCRCKMYNQTVGGARGSQHRWGKAADVVVVDVPAEEVQTYLEHHPGGLGKYATFTHVDVRDGKARWDG